jgi:hypothetical protein
MGRQPWSDRFTVEECRSLRVADLVRGRTIIHGNSPGSPESPHPICWLSGFEANACYDRNGKGGGTLRLAYTIRGERIADRIDVTSIPAPLGYGRHRFYFLCTGLDGKTCGRRVGKLYMPPGENRFGCRTCWNLTYQSSKEHDKREDFFRRLSPEELGQALQSPNWITKWFAFRAAQRLLKKTRT